MVLPPYVVIDLYQKRWRLEDAFNVDKKFLKRSRPESRQNQLDMLSIPHSHTNLLIVYKDLMIDIVYAGKNVILYIQPFVYTIFYQYKVHDEQ